METYFLLVVLFIQVNILFGMEPLRTSCQRGGNFNGKDVGKYLLGLFPFKFAKSWKVLSTFSSAEKNEISK